jgi:hypothetical protein
MATMKQPKDGIVRQTVADRLFLEHPRSLGMSWGSHGAGAAKVGFQLIGAGCAALVHAIVPGLFGETASKTVVRIYDHIQNLDAKRSENA